MHPLGVLTTHLDADEKGVTDLVTPGGPQQKPTVALDLDEKGATTVRTPGVPEALGLANSRDALGKLEADEKADVALTDTSSNGVTQRRTVAVVTEPGLYKLIMRSRKPTAKTLCSSGRPLSCG